MQAELLPSARQTLWGRLAVVNFFLGGAGAGAYVIGVVLSGFQRTPILALVSVLGPVLVVTGFLCVAVEAGHPLRGPFVLRKIRSSWMSRELWAGGLFILFVIADLFNPLLLLRVGAVSAALLFALAQGAILSRAKGVIAWNVPLMPPLFLASALVSGAGLLDLALPLWGAHPGFQPALAFSLGTRPGGATLASLTAGLIVLSALVWIGYLAWSSAFAFRQATASLRSASAVAGVFVVGHLIPLFLLALGFQVPALTWAALAGVSVLLGQLQAKAWLILRAGELRPVTIPYFRLLRAP